MLIPGFIYDTSSTVKPPKKGTSLKLEGSTSGNMVFAVPSTITTHTIIFPSANASGVLTNDGSGNLSWGAGGGGGGSPGGSGTEFQYRSGASTFGAITGSSWDGSVATLPTLAVTDITAGGVPYAGTGGRLTYDSLLVWDGSNHRLGINKATSIGAMVHVVSNNASIPNFIATQAPSSTADFLSCFASNGTTKLACVNSFGAIMQAPSAAASGAVNQYLLTAAANTGQTASTEAIDVYYNLGRTVTWAAGALTTQRFMYIAAPTMAFASASTCTTAVTLDIGGYPAAGTNATITNKYSLRVTGQTILATSTTTDANLRIPILSGQSGNAITVVNSGSATIFSVDSTGVIATTPGITVVGVSTSHIISQTIVNSSSQAGYALKISGDANNRFVIGLDSGTPFIAVGAGSTARDCFLYREAAANWRFGAAAAASPVAQTLSVQNATGTNVAGAASFSIVGPAGTGTGTGGDLLLRVCPAGSTGSAVNTAKTVLTIDKSGDFVYFDQQGSSTYPALVLRQSAGVGGYISIRNSSVDSIGIGTERSLGGSGSASNGVLFCSQTSGSIGIATATAAGVSAVGYIKQQWDASGNVLAVTAAKTSGTPTAYKLTPAANTGMTASTEVPDVNYVLNRTVQWATGALTTQRAFLVQAPTYAFVGASTITNAATFAVSGAPSAGTNATITNAYSIWVQGGTSRFDGHISYADGVNVVCGTTTGTIFGTGTTQKLAFWNATPIVQPTTGVAASTRVGGGGSTITDTDTFDGYTIAQLAKIIRNLGLAA